MSPSESSRPRRLSGVHISYGNIIVIVTNMSPSESSRPRRLSGVPAPLHPRNRRAVGDAGIEPSAMPACIRYQRMLARSGVRVAARACRRFRPAWTRPTRPCTGTMEFLSSLQSYGLCRYGLYSYGLYSHGRCSYGATHEAPYRLEF